MKRNTMTAETIMELCDKAGLWCLVDEQDSSCYVVYDEKNKLYAPAYTIDDLRRACLDEDYRTQVMLPVSNDSKFKDFVDNWNVIFDNAYDEGFLHSRLCDNINFRDETTSMKKLNITKEAYNKSKYFQGRYGKLEYVSESGKVFKTSKGQLLKFNN